MSLHIANPTAVLPEPGGPVNKIPFGGLIFNFSNILLFSKGKYIYYCKVSINLSKPPN